MSWQVGLYLAAILIPLLAFGVTAVNARRWSGRTSALVSIAAIAASLALSLVGLVAYLIASGGLTHAEAPVWRATWTWAAPGGPIGSGTALTIPIGVDIDNLAALMFVVVTAIALAVELYALESMRDDPHQGRFFAEISLFCASMLGLVAASNLFFVFVGWELVGFCSYLLVGFWSEHDHNARAANKAFVVNRIGDVGMLLGLGLLWSNLGTTDFRTLNESIRNADGQMRVEQSEGQAVVRLVGDQGGSIPYGVLTVAGLGLFVGCMAKSAQFPLHVWLPDAMAGPTPASALIHAATMVAAGVYLLARVMPLLTPEVSLVVAYTGATTLILAASIAIVQDDYKKVLAYSTISQLGFMMVGLGVGGRSAGLFHLVTHAGFKATLFLAAGSVYTATHTYKLEDLGGLYPRLKTTALVMLVATLAIAGVPLFSGFASKDAILASTLHFVRAHPGQWLLFLLPVVGTALTAFYMFRIWFLIFAGEPRTEAAERAVEPGRLVRWTLIALAVPSVVAGWTVVILPLGFEPLVEIWLKYAEPIESVDPGDAHWWAIGASILVGSVGIGLGVLAYGPWDAWKRIHPRRAAERFGPIHRFLAAGWHLDALYRYFIVRPMRGLARGVGLLDRRGIDAVVNGSAAGVKQLSRFEAVFDRIAVDGLVTLVARSVYVLGDQGRRLQSGQLRSYMMGLAVAAAGLFALLYAWVGR